MDVKNFVKILGADYFTGVPDSQLKALCNYLMQQYGVELCLYGHLHSYAIQTAMEGSMWEIEFRLVSADHLGFAPKLLCQI